MRRITIITVIFLIAAMVSACGSKKDTGGVKKTGEEAVQQSDSEKADTVENIESSDETFKITYKSEDYTIPAEIAASKIGLPTSGVEIISAELISEDAENNLNREYCKVLGSIHPVDSAAPDIKFQVNLPMDWNGKILQYGGSGFNGELVTAVDEYDGQKATDPVPLAQGYVTFGSDGGHESLEWDAQWALNDEALKNFASDQLKKTKDTVLEIVKAFYQEEPSEIYFAGGSNGGREALKVAQLFPEEYNGIICLYPVLNWVPKALADNRNANAVMENNGAGWISLEEYREIERSFLEICDGLDGAEDGLISNLSAAESKEKEIRAVVGEQLSEEQMKTLEVFASSMEFSFPMANGITVMPGYPVFEGSPLMDMFVNQYGSEPNVRDGVMAQFSEGVIKYMIAGDENLDLTAFDEEEYREQIETASELLDATNPDLSAFRENGGKLIMIHGTADQLVTYKGTVEYYNQLVEKFGQETLDEFVKFYLVPGYGHYFSEKFYMGADVLGALDQWVESGHAPENLIAVDQNEVTAGRTRALCEYPAYLEYTGSGDINKAENFIVVEP